MNHVEFDWDFENIRHIARHGVTPEEAEEALSGPTLEIPTEDDTAEERLSEIGMTKNGRILLIVTTLRDQRLRIVTAFEPNVRIKKYYLVARGL